MLSLRPRYDNSGSDVLAGLPLVPKERHVNGPEILTIERERLARAVAEAGTPHAPEPLPISAWVAMSLLQKAVRRGETQQALLPRCGRGRVQVDDEEPPETAPKPRIPGGAELVTLRVPRESLTTSRTTGRGGRIEWSQLCDSPPASESCG